MRGPGKRHALHPQRARGHDLHLDALAGRRRRGPHRLRFDFAPLGVSPARFATGRGWLVVLVSVIDGCSSWYPYWRLSNLKRGSIRRREAALGPVSRSPGDGGQLLDGQLCSQHA